MIQGGTRGQSLGLLVGQRDSGTVGQQETVRESEEVKIQLQFFHTHFGVIMDNGLSGVERGGGGGGREAGWPLFFP